MVIVRVEATYPICHCMHKNHIYLKAEKFSDGKYADIALFVCLFICFTGQEISAVEKILP